MKNKLRAAHQLMGKPKNKEKGKGMQVRVVTSNKLNSNSYM